MGHVVDVATVFVLVKGYQGNDVDQIRQAENDSFDYVEYFVGIINFLALLKPEHDQLQRQENGRAKLVSLC